MAKKKTQEIAIKKSGFTVLAIPDCHLPAEHPEALNHCLKLKEIYNPDKIVFLGDILDLHRASFHDQEPAMPSLYDEIQICKERIKPWIKAFPKAYVMKSNHDSRIYRVAAKAGLDASLVRSESEIFGLPDTWEFHDYIVIDGVRYEHGMSCKGGAGGHYVSVTKHRQSVVYGHYHSFAGIVWSATEQDLLFGFNVGSMIDVKHLAMRYGKHFVNKPVLGAGIIINGIFPQFIPMNLGAKIERLD